MSEPHNFDRVVNRYDSTRGFPPGIEDAIGEFIVQFSELPAGAKILEIGVGTGRIAVPVVRQGLRVFGIDISEQMLHRLQEKTSDVQVARADVRRLPFLATSFDAVIVVHVLHLVEQPQLVLQEIQRVLRPEGYLIQGHNERVSEGRMKLLWDAWQQSSSGAQRRKDWISINQTAPAAGWQAVKPIGQFRYPISQTPRSFLQNLESRTWSSTWSMSDEDMEKGLSAVRTVIDAEFGDALDEQIEMQSSFSVQVFRAPTSG